MLRRDGVCVVLKTRKTRCRKSNIGAVISAFPAMRPVLAQLDAMTLKVTPLRPMQTVILEFEAL